MILGVIVLLVTGCVAAQIAVSRVGHSTVATVTRPTVNGDLFHDLLAHSRDLGAVRPDLEVSLTLLLKDPTAMKEAAELMALYDPHSPTFGRFLTNSQYEDAYGPRPAVVARIKTILRRDGLRIAWQRGDDWLTVRGPARQIETVFRVHVRRYISPTGIPFYASAHDPIVPAALRTDVTGASHISSYVHPHKDAVRTGGMWPDDLRKAYDIAPLLAYADGRGETVVFFEYDGFKQSDLNTFSDRFRLPRVYPTIANERTAGRLPPGPETPMDLETVHAIAPYAQLVVYNCNEACASDEATTETLQRQMLREHPGAIFSESWSSCDKDLGKTIAQTYLNIYSRGAASGDAVFASSGDSGAFECLRNHDFKTQNWETPPTQQYIGAALPAAAPDVTAVGGTRISVNTRGGWYNETVWTDPAITEGSGGAPSAFYPMPYWQNAPGVREQVARYNHTRRRMIPDVSADADGTSGVADYCTGPECPPRGWGQGGGTSLSAPIWAGIAALIDEYLQRRHVRRVGAMNPALYAVANAQYPPFHDVTMGDNLWYQAGRRYDMATGLGTPDAWNLARELEIYERTGRP
jgi:kumamolisin